MWIFELCMILIERLIRNLLDSLSPTTAVGLSDDLITDPGIDTIVLDQLREEPAACVGEPDLHPYA
jgi:hypothetical protein